MFTSAISGKTRVVFDSYELSKEDKQIRRPNELNAVDLATIDELVSTPLIFYEFWDAS